jgi:hypothetical protein
MPLHNHENSEELGFDSAGGLFFTMGFTSGVSRFCTVGSVEALPQHDATTHPFQICVKDPRCQNE